MSVRPGGFTLIELIASAVLSAMLAVGLLSVVWSTTRETVPLRRARAEAFPGEVLADLLRRDFHNARGIAVGGSVIRLHGFLARDAATGGELLLEGRVRYELVPCLGRSLLLRRDLTAGGAAEPLWLGCGQLRFEPLDVVGPNGQGVENAESLRLAGGLNPLPSAFRLTLTDGRGVIVWREVIHHHEP